MVAAALQFTQGIYTDTAGKAVVGRSNGGNIVLANGDNTGVVKWSYLLLDKPKNSALTVGVMYTGASPTHIFAPDVFGSYRVMVIVEDATGVRASDVRQFIALDSRFILAPPSFGNVDEREYNYGSNERGWADLLEPYFTGLHEVVPWVRLYVEMATAQAVVIAKSMNPSILADGSQFTWSPTAVGNGTITWSATLFNNSDWAPRASIYGENVGTPPSTAVFRHAHAGLLTSNSLRVNVYDGNNNPYDSDHVMVEIFSK